MTTRPTGPDAGADDGDRSVAAAGRNSGQLTRSIILQAALAIVDRDGVDGLSMRRLSDALGRDPVMIYRHVPSKAAVLDGVAEIVLAQLSVTTADPDWAGQLRPGAPEGSTAAGHSTVGHPARAAATWNAAPTRRRPRTAHIRRVRRR